MVITFIDATKKPDKGDDTVAKSTGSGSNGAGNSELPPPTSEPLTETKLSRFRIDGTNYTEPTTEVLTTVLIAPPSKDEFIRVHPDPAMRLVTYTIRDSREHYLIDPTAFPVIKATVKDFARHAAAVTLRPYLTREGGQINLWPLKMESPYAVGGNSYNVSAFNVAREAETTWLRVTLVDKRGQYVGFRPEESFAEPVWPEITIDQLVDMASRVNLVDSIDHPFVRKLRGLAAI